MPKTRNSDVKTRRWDAADYIESSADAVAFLNSCIEDDLADTTETGDGRVFRAALRDVARAMGRMSRLSSDADVPRRTLYRAVSESGNPSFDTVYKLIRALGLRLRVEMVDSDPQTQ